MFVRYTETIYQPILEDIQKLSNYLLGHMSKNRYGLARHIPADIAQEVRRRSKFGCVICRCGIYQYEHIDPEFADATQHAPDHICLLCGGCHDRVTRGRLSKETVRAKYEEIQRTDRVRRPFENLDLASANIRVQLGTASFEFSKTLIRVNGEDLLAIRPPKDGAAFPTIDGVFYDRKGRESFRITDNVWEGPLDAWDIEVVGTSVTIRTEERRVALSFDVVPPGEIRITRLDMYKDNCHIICDREQILIGQTHNAGSVYFGLGNFSCKGASAGIAVASHVDHPPVFRGIQMSEGEGILLDGTGIRIAAGAAQMHVMELRVWQA